VIDVDGPHGELIARLAAGGCVAPREEADALVKAAEGTERLDDLVARRLSGEPLAWITGSVAFCEINVRVDRGVYVPRPHTEILARRAAELLPATGIAVDLCTGTGAVAVVLRSARPGATIAATDSDHAAIACASANGVTALLGDLDGPLPDHLRGRVDVMTAVVPYVPTEELHLLPRDVLAFEPRQALDGGPGGTIVLERVIRRSARWLRPGGRLVLELGGDQAERLGDAILAAGLALIDVYRDGDGRDRAIELASPSGNSVIGVRGRP
jgi:release factor glutamine methyltransferase